MGDPRWLTIRPGWLPEWWVVEYETPGGLFRAGGADVEGDTDEMAALSAAIIGGRPYRGGSRCACEPSGDRVLLWSPRNSVERAAVPLDVALALGWRIREVLRG